MEKKIKTLASQRDLLLLKKEKRDKLFNHLNDEILKTVAQIAIEQGIPENELNQWELDDKAEYFEKKSIPTQ